MEQPFTSFDAAKPFSEEAAPAASSTPHHDGACDETAMIVPFRRTVLADAVLPSSSALLSPVIPLGVPSTADIPGLARQMIVAAVAFIAPKKNVPLTLDDLGKVANAVVAALELADLYRLAMGEAAAVTKTGERIAGELDAVAITGVAVRVLQHENMRVDDARHPDVLGIVTVIVKKIALAAPSGPIIWPDIAAAVADYYGAPETVEASS